MFLCKWKTCHVEKTGSFCFNSYSMDSKRQGNVFRDIFFGNLLQKSSSPRVFFSKNALLEHPWRCHEKCDSYNVSFCVWQCFCMVASLEIRFPLSVDLVSLFLSCQSISCWLSLQSEDHDRNYTLFVTLTLLYFLFTPHFMRQEDWSLSSLISMEWLNPLISCRNDRQWTCLWAEMLLAIKGNCCQRKKHWREWSIFLIWQRPIDYPIQGMVFSLSFCTTDSGMNHHHETNTLLR